MDFLVLPIRRNQDGNRLAYDFVRLISKKSLSASIPTRDGTGEVLAYDGIVRGLDNRCKELRVLLDALAIGDVDQHVDGPDELAGSVAQGCWIRDKGKSGAVRPLGYRFDAPHRTSCPQCDGHRAFIMAHGGAVGPVQP